MKFVYSRVVLIRPLLLCMCVVVCVCTNKSKVAHKITIAQPIHFICMNIFERMRNSKTHHLH